MTFPDYISTHKPRLQKHLSSFIQNQPKKELPFYSDSLTQISSLAVSGKMLRGLFVLMMYEWTSGNEYGEEQLNAAVAIELLQTALLTHDDIIDNDYTRRGQRSIFAQYVDLAEKEKLPDKETFGKNMGIGVGDIAIFLGYDALSQSTTDPSHLAKLIQLFSREFHLVGIGEMMDVHMAASEAESSEEDIINMYRYKTARYSISLPFMIGAILGGASEQTISQLSELGEDMGILFQIHDDELGLIGNAEQTGKPVGADIKENKKTLHRNYLMQTASSVDKHFLEEAFGNKSLSSEDFKRIISLLDTYNILEKVEEKKQILRQKIVASIEKLTMNKDYKNSLIEIMELITHRTN